MDQLIGSGGQAVALIALAAVPALGLWALLTAIRARRVGRREAMWSAALDVGVVLSLVLIAVVALRPGYGETPGWVQWNLVPFVDLTRSLREAAWARDIAIANLVGNVLFFVPWGIAAALRFPVMRRRTLIVLTAAISLAVEVGQAVEATGRISDVTDILMNTLGGAVGFALVRLLQRLRSSASSTTEAAPPGR